MKSTKRLLAMLLTLVMAVSLSAGCAQTNKSAGTSQQDTEQTGKSDASEESQEPDAASSREITDMAGRTVTVPAAEEIKSIFSAGPVSAIFLYMAAPDKLLGWNYELNDTEKSIILEEYHDIPNFGMGDAVNYEAVIAANPTIAVNCGTCLLYTSPSPRDP